MRFVGSLHSGFSKGYIENIKSPVDKYIIKKYFTVAFNLSATLLCKASGKLEYCMKVEQLYE